MSTASISYSSLWNAAGEAKDVAKKMDAYAKSINNSVYKKLNKYDGSWTGNISNAYTKANQKISALEDEADKYRDYADDLDSLRKECDSVDEAVKSKVFTLTASFKKAHGINNNVVVNAIGYIFTSRTNSSAAGRWINDKTDTFEADVEYVKQAIEDWYDYNGGKEFVKGIVVAAITIAIAVIGILTGTGWIAILGAVIALANGVVDAINEFRALSVAGDDPATARRLSDRDTMQDTLREETDSELGHFLAGVIDVAQIVCAVSSLISDGSKLLKNGYKWATGSMDDISRIKVSDLFSKEFFSGLGGKIKEFATSVKFGGWEFGKELLVNFGKNLKLEYLTDIDIGTVKSYLKIGKTLVKDGITIPAILEFVLGPGLKVDVTTAKFDGGKTSVSFDQLTFGDLFGVIDDIGSKVIGSNLFKEHTTIDVSILEQLQQPIDINISIPDIVVPQIPQVVYV